MSKIKKLVCIGLAMSLSACASMGGFGVASIPKKPISSSDISTLSNNYSKASCLEGNAQKCANKKVLRDGGWIDKMQKCASVSANGTVCKKHRNVIIGELLLIIDYNYASYEGNLLAGQAKSNFYIGAARTSLETASTLFAPAGTKTILSALATLTGTVQESVQKEFYFDATAPALIKLMQADRKLITASILVGMGKEYEDYSIPLAIRDLDALFRAGTIASAVTSLSDAASDKDGDGDEALDKVSADIKEYKADRKEAQGS